MKNVLKVSMCIIGAIIGAGFATGREISTFFVRYGNKSIAGILISSILFGVYIYNVIKKINEDNPKTEYEYLKSISNSHFAKFSLWITYFMLFVSFCVMISGSANIINNEFEIPYFLSAVIVSAVCFVTFVMGKTGIMAAGSFLTPVMILGMFYLAYLAKKDLTVFSSFSNNYITSSFIYVSYNTLPLLSFVFTLASELKNKKEIFGASFVTSLVIFFTMSALWYILVKFDGMYLDYDMPLLKISERYGATFQKFYTVVLLFAMLTTALSSGFALISSMDKKTKITQNKLVKPFILCGLSAVMSLVGFANFIDRVYPFFGYLGLIVFFIIFFDILRNVKKNREKTSK